MVGQYPLELPAIHASGGEFWQVVDAEPPDLKGLQLVRWLLCAGGLTEEEQLVDAVRQFGCVSASVTVPAPDQLHHLSAVTGLLADLADHGLAWGVPRIGEPAGKRPPPIGAFAHHQQPATLDDQGTTHFDLGCHGPDPSAQLHLQLMPVSYTHLTLPTKRIV